MDYSSKKHIPTWLGLVIIVLVAIVAFGAVFAYEYYYTGNIQFPIVAIKPGWKTYTNSQYGFEINFPDSWKNYSVEKSSWEGHLIDNYSVKYTGVMFIFKNQQLAQKGFIGIPIMVIEPDVWKLMLEEKVAVSAAPIGPAKVGQNSKYVFATPPRYVGFAGDLNTDEINQVYNIVKTFKAF